MAMSVIGAPPLVYLKNLPAFSTCSCVPNLVNPTQKNHLYQPTNR